MIKRNYFIRTFKILLFLILSVSLLHADEPFSKDVDHDGFPDDLEKATGYNPRVNQALVNSSKGGKCGVIKTDLLKIGEPQNVLIILDISGSMKGTMGDSTRMEIAKKILAKYLKALPPSMKISFVIYGKIGCGDNSIELVAPMGKHNRNSLITRINSLQPKGTTPIALTLDKTGKFLKGFEKENNNLILISDGKESCGGNPVQSILKLKESPANPEVTVIGLNVNRATRSQLAKIASSSDGVYTDVKSEEDFVKAFASFFKKMGKFYKDIVCIIRQYNSYLAYETQQYNKSKSYIIKASTKAFDDKTRNALKALEKKLDKNHDARIKAKDKLEIMIKNKLEEMETATKKFVGN